MCLFKGHKTIDEFLAKNKGKKKVTVWKAYKTNSFGYVYPMFFPKGIDIRPGLILSDRQSRSHDKSDNDCYIYKGIHVCLTRREARLWCEDDGERVFKCTALLCDLIAVGHDSDSGEAVFMKIHISKEEFEKGKKGRN